MHLPDFRLIGEPRRFRKRIRRIIEKAGYSTYAEVDPITVRAAIADLIEEGTIQTTCTANKHVEAARAWARWLKRYGRWPTNPLEDLDKFKGDTSPTRRRAILSDDQFATLIASTRRGEMRRNLLGEERAWLYLIAAQTGLRASELNSLTPASFVLGGDRPHVVVHCTISKRRTTDQVDISTAFAQMLRPWVADKPKDQRLWARSRSWTGKAAAMLRADLKAAGLPTEVETESGSAHIDFHGLRCQRITNLLLTGAPSQVVLKAARLSTEALLQRYQKIPEAAVRQCVEAVPPPRLGQEDVA